MGKKLLPFDSALSKKQSIAVLAYLPLHLIVLPNLLAAIMLKGYIGEADANLLLYAIGAVYMLVFCWKFLRRDFDPLMDNLLHILVEICISYGLMFVFNLIVNGLLFKLFPLDNPNNAAIIGIASQEYGKTAALAIFLAPIVEELLFRAGIFGVLRRYNRLLGYTVSVLAFAAYHIWPFAINDSSYWVYMIQYIPVSCLLCRVYERCNSIWGSIGFHMMVNAISIKTLMMLQELM